MPRSSNFSSTVGALKQRTYSPYSVMSRFNRSPPLLIKVDHAKYNPHSKFTKLQSHI